MHLYSRTRRQMWVESFASSLLYFKKFFKVGISLSDIGTTSWCVTFTSNFLLYKGTYGVLPPEEYKFTEHQASWQAKILLRLVMKTKNSGFRLLEVSVTKFSVFLGRFLCNIFSFFGFRSLETALGDFFFLLWVSQWFYASDLITGIISTCFGLNEVFFFATSVVTLVYRHQEFQFPLLNAAHCGTESEHQCSNGSVIGLFSLFILSPFTRIWEPCTK